MTKKRRQYPGKHGVIDLGSGVKLYSESWFVSALAPFGMTVLGFRALCRNLRVPMIHIGRTRFVDKMSITLAFRAINTIGRKDFLVPGADEARAGRASKRSDLYSVELDPVFLKENWELLLREIIYARRLNMLADDDQLESLVKTGVDRLMQASLEFRPFPIKKCAYDLDEEQSRKEREGRDPWETRTKTLNSHRVNLDSLSSSAQKTSSLSSFNDSPGPSLSPSTPVPSPVRTP